MIIDDMHYPMNERSLSLEKRGHKGRERGSGDRLRPAAGASGDVNVRVCNGLAAVKPVLVQTTMQIY